MIDEGILKGQVYYPHGDPLKSAWRRPAKQADMDKLPRHEPQGAVLWPDIGYRGRPLIGWVNSHQDWLIEHGWMTTLSPCGEYHPYGCEPYISGSQVVYPHGKPLSAAETKRREAEAKRRGLRDAKMAAEKAETEAALARKGWTIGDVSGAWATVVCFVIWFVTGMIADAMWDGAGWLGLLPAIWWVVAWNDDHERVKVLRRPLAELSLPREVSVEQIQCPFHSGDPRQAAKAVEAAARAQREAAVRAQIRREREEAAEAAKASYEAAKAAEAAKAQPAWKPDPSAELYGSTGERDSEPSFPAPELLSWLEYDASVLMREHPPVLRNANKQVVFTVACPDHTAGGHVSYSRWAEMPLPATVDPARAATLLVVRDGFFDYEPVAEAEPAVEWHLNFADPNLFCAYGSTLFGQDEMQVAEHPVLGTIREAFVAAGRTPLTVERGRPTPALVMGAERRVRIMTDRPAQAGGPSWLDGIAFAEASADVVRRATTRIDPPTITNIIAMAAPAGGHGRYRREQIELILATAFTGFRVAVLKSRRVAGADTQAIVHSGFWGCGAFGGNRVLMTMLQALAAEMAGLYRLVLHIGEPSGRASVVQATAIFRDTLAAGGSIDTAELVSRIEAMGLEWGHSDGN
jgi:hypothetical protein